MKRLLTVLSLGALLTGCASYQSALESTAEYLNARDAKGCVYGQYLGTRGQVTVVIAVGGIDPASCVPKPIVPSIPNV